MRWPKHVLTGRNFFPLPTRGTLLFLGTALLRSAHTRVFGSKLNSLVGRRALARPLRPSISFWLPAFFCRLPAQECQRIRFPFGRPTFSYSFHRSLARSLRALEFEDSVDF